jgi:chromosome segregation ATPase
MDQELISFLDQRFREASRQVEGLREETMQRFEQVDRRFEQIDTRFEQVDRRFEQIDVRFEQVDRRFEQVDRRFERVDEGIRHTRIEIEGLRGDIQAVAEGFMGLDERLVAFRADVATDFREVQSSVRPPFEHLDNRLRTLEIRAENEAKDPMVVIREKFGKRPEQA